MQFTKYNWSLFWFLIDFPNCEEGVWKEGNCEEDDAQQLGNFICAD